MRTPTPNHAQQRTGVRVMAHASRRLRPPATFPAMLNKTALRFLMMLSLPAFHIHAEEPKVPPQEVWVKLLDMNLLDVLQLYSKWTGRKVWVALDLFPVPDIRAKLDAPIPLPEAIQFLRKTLLEHYGIELRDSGDKEVFASYSDDPKYKKVRGALRKGVDREPVESGIAKPPVRSPNVPAK